MAASFWVSPAGVRHASEECVSLGQGSVAKVTFWCIIRAQDSGETPFSLPLTQSSKPGCSGGAAVGEKTEEQGGRAPRGGRGGDHHPGDDDPCAPGAGEGQGRARKRFGRHEAARGTGRLP